MTPLDVLLILGYMWGGAVVAIAIAAAGATLADRHDWHFGWAPEDDLGPTAPAATSPTRRQHR